MYITECCCTVYKSKPTFSSRIAFVFYTTCSVVYGHACIHTVCNSFVCVHAINKGTRCVDRPNRWPFQHTSLSG